MDDAVRHLVAKYSPKGNRIGWLMMASILVEAWDLYSIAFVLIFISQQFHPGPLLLGLAAAATQGGAVIGALLGGWLADKIGRRVMFLSTMIMFIIFALAQAFVPNVVWLVIVRFILGMPLGSDISNGYTYIMESMRKGDREVMGNRWQFMFAVGQVLTLAVVTILILSQMPHELIWRVTLGLAKRVAKDLFGDSLDMLPNNDIVVPHPHPTEFLADTRKDPIRWRATLYGWIACFAQSGEFSTFAFYIPILFVMVGVSSILGTTLVTMALYIFAAISGWVGPMITPRIGHRGIGIAGFGIVLVALLVAAGALYSGQTFLLPFAAAVMLWGHYWDASNCMTIPSLVAKPQYRGTASGFAYMFVKLPTFLGIFLFPSLFASIGQANATLLIVVFPLIGLLAAIFVLPEVYGYEQD
jgi:MFS family permease